MILDGRLVHADAFWLFILIFIVAGSCRRQVVFLTSFGQVAKANPCFFAPARTLTREHEALASAGGGQYLGHWGRQQRANRRKLRNNPLKHEISFETGKEARRTCEAEVTVKVFKRMSPIATSHGASVYRIGDVFLRELLSNAARCLREIAL